MDMGFAATGPLARHDMPQIRFLFIGPRLCLALPSDLTSPRRLWGRLSFTSIRLDRDFHPELSNMLGAPSRRHSVAEDAAPLISGHEPDVERSPHPTKSGR
jgi:hypothetical protein